jgi:hypothetical protein
MWEAIVYALLGAELLWIVQMGWHEFIKRNNKKKSPTKANTGRVEAESEDDKAYGNGISVQTDCRACGQMNRVVQSGLLLKPKCGKCKAPLMPKKTIVILTRESMKDPNYLEEVDKHWNDNEKLWRTIYAQTLRNAAKSYNPVIQVDMSKMN